MASEESQISSLFCFYLKVPAAPASSSRLALEASATTPSRMVEQVEEEVVDVTSAVVPGLGARGG
ncbi:hypothetical protein ES332_A06G207800v1 [Gossypium tomentosum]|uniref:Uncharacterized protein n=1 Tax=Gossypium tomentosum TaxID=34277 RepID=A0A5D2Q6H2_GOSTO|nr:hypothetical protein ES332_A06G207800v1 [Gossypium tomentosum]